MTDTNTVAADLSILTPAEAATKLDTLTADANFAAKLLSGDGTARKTFDDLLAVKHKSESDRLEAALAGTLQPVQFETITAGKLSAYNLTLGLQSLKDIGVEEKQLRSFLTDEPISADDRKMIATYEKQLLGDAEFVKRWLSGDLAARKEIATIKMHKLRPVSG